MTRFDDRVDSITVTTEDGRSFTGAVLIGADGIRSRTRAHLFNDGEPRPERVHGLSHHRADRDRAGGRAARISWRYGAARDSTSSIIRSVMGRCSTSWRCSDGRLISERGDIAAYRAELEHAYRDAHPTMKALLAMLDLSRRQAVGDRDPIRRWHKGRICLLGDAAHPTLQSLAQGACMAIEDGVCLAECIDDAGGDFAAAFARFESARSLRTARVTLESRAIWEFYHADGIARDVCFQQLGERTEADTFQCLAWLYDGFALPAAAYQA